MAVIIDLKSAMALPKGQLRSWAYNALDCTGTREVADVLLPRLDTATARTYAFERQIQAPALAMMRRGIRVDIQARAKAIGDLKKELLKDQTTIAKLPQVAEVWDGWELETGWCPAEVGKRHKWPRGVEDSPERKCERCGASRVKPLAFNPSSDDQTNHLFYDLFKCKPVRNKKQKISTDHDCLERIGRAQPQYQPVVDAILAIRDKVKQLGMLNAKLSPDSRYHSSFNVGAAWTGRFSSSQNPFRWGGNAQNITERHRHIFIADPGYELCYADLKQAESLLVAFLSGDEKYIDAHQSGDTHTYVCRLLWPNLPWTGDLKKDKAVAKALPPWDPVPGHDWRFQAKRIQHGSNYGLTPQGISMIAHIPLAVAREAQGNFFHGFPYIRGWQEKVAMKVRNSEPLVNPLGRRCRLFGRPWDPHTYKQGLAHDPQSGVADILDTALWLVWNECDPGLIQLLAQVHDAILSQHLKAERERAIETLNRLMSLPVTVTDYSGKTRTMNIPVEIAVGDNWGHKSPTNPFGIEEISL